jgi:hypothetical protein
MHCCIVHLQRNIMRLRRIKNDPIRVVVANGGGGQIKWEMKFNFYFNVSSRLRRIIRDPDEFDIAHGHCTRTTRYRSASKLGQLKENVTCKLITSPQTLIITKSIILVLHLTYKYQTFIAIIYSRAIEINIFNFN